MFLMTQVCPLPHAYPAHSTQQFVNMSSTKLVRVSNSFTSKKLIPSDGNFEDFVTSVRTKFDLGNEVIIRLEDDQGAEVDSDVFHILLEIENIPNIVFKLGGEESHHITINLNPDDRNSSSSTELMFTHSPSSKIQRLQQDGFNQVLGNSINDNQEISRVVADCNTKGFVDDKSAVILVQEFVSKLVELKGESPSSSDQKNLASAIIQYIPCWRYAGSTEGLDILFDEIGRSGLIQRRLRTIHQKLKTTEKKKELRAKKTQLGTGGPKPKTAKLDDNVDNGQYDELVRSLNGSSAKSGSAEIIKLAQDTLEHRNYLRRVNPQSILLVYTKFADCDFLIRLEFSLLQGESQENFTRIWPSFSSQLLEKVKDLKQSPSLCKFLTEESDNWDSEVAALFVLLYLIPPAAQGRGKGSQCTIDEAKNLLISFYKTATPLPSILDTWSEDKRQPNLLCLGENKKTLSSFYLVVDKVLLPIDAKNSAQAIDLLFKSHYVFGAEYDKNLQGLWKFLQVYIYKVDVDSTDLSGKVKSVFTQLSNIFNNLI
ncbi:uncharacterized protein LOC110853528 [Folsomia candida]|nr:uncharacterized protein LOC110853528 [Folsomia candida]